MGSLVFGFYSTAYAGALDSPVCKTIEGTTYSTSYGDAKAKFLSNGYASGQEFLDQRTPLHQSREKLRIEFLHSKTTRGAFSKSINANQSIDISFRSIYLPHEAGRIIYTEIEKKHYLGPVNKREWTGWENSALAPKIRPHINQFCSSDIDTECKNLEHSFHIMASSPVGGNGYQCKLHISAGSSGSRNTQLVVREHLIWQPVDSLYVVR